MFKIKSSAIITVMRLGPASPRPAGRDPEPAHVPKSVASEGTEALARGSAAARRVPAAILAIYLALATLYNLAVPVGEAPDEPAHVENIRIILRTGQLPTIPVGSPRYSYEAQQPPLYYILGAGWMKLLWPNTDILPSLPDNPDFSFAKEIPYNAYLHTYPARDAVPVHLLRLLSTLIGSATLILIWLGACEAWDTPQARQFPLAALFALGFAAFLPGFTFTSGTVSNDTAAAATGAGLFYASIYIVKRGATLPMAALAGAVLGLGLLSKWTLAFLAPLPVLACLLAPNNRWRARLAQIAVVGLAALLVGGWPFLGNYLEYGDPLATRARLAAHTDVLSPLATMPFFWLDYSFIGALLDSLWGVFGLRNMELPSLAYLPYYLLLLLGAAYLFLSLRRAGAAERKVLALIVTGLVLSYASVAYVNMQVWAVQGRLLLPGLLAFALLVGRGTAFIFEALPTRPRTDLIIVSLVLAGLLFLNLYALVGKLIPGYYG